MRHGGVRAIVAFLVAVGIASCSSDDDESPMPGTVVVELRDMRDSYPDAGSIRLCVAERCSNHGDPQDTKQLKVPLEDVGGGTVHVTLAVVGQDGTPIDRSSSLGHFTEEPSGERIATLRFIAESALLADEQKRQRIAFTEATAHPAAISFWDEDRGLVGTGGSNATESDGTILSTSDGGRTFDVALETGLPVTWLDTTGSMDAWAELGGEQTQVLLHSIDGGDTWQEEPIGNAAHRSFATPRIGMALTRSPEPGQEKLIYTSDGGESWQRRLAPCRYHDGLFVSMPSPTAAWAACETVVGGGTVAETVYFTPTAGLSWEERGDAGLVATVASSIAFSEDGVGLIVGGGLHSETLSTDGGGTWHGARLRFRGPYLTSASVTEGGQILALLASSPSRLIQSADGGATWTVRHSWPKDRIY
jgi:photosystem II stability/assembly factor-like uncharacterized protein